MKKMPAVKGKARAKPTPGGSDFSDASWREGDSELARCQLGEALAFWYGLTAPELQQLAGLEDGTSRRSRWRINRGRIVPRTALARIPKAVLKALHKAGKKIIRKS